MSFAFAKYVEGVTKKIAILTILGTFILGQLLLSPNVSARSSELKIEITQVVSKKQNGNRFLVLVSFRVSGLTGNEKLSKSVVSLGAAKCSASPKSRLCTFKSLKKGSSIRILGQAFSSRRTSRKSVKITYSVGAPKWRSSRLDEKNIPSGGAGSTTTTTPLRSSDACTLIGTAGDDRIIGTPGRDVICGNGGKDVIDGMAGDDVIYSTAPTVKSAAVHLMGKNVHSQSVDTAGDVLSGGEGNDVIYGGSGADEMSGSDGDDVIMGGDGADTLVGGDGVDSLFGESGEDDLAGGEGNDALDGGAEPDDLDGGPGTNRCTYSNEDRVKPNCDSGPPVLVSAVAPGSVDASLSSQSVIVDAVVTDDVAGVSDVFIWVLGPDGQDIQNGNATLISGDAMSGTYRNTFTIPRYAQSGNWRVDVQLRDAAGNRRSVSSAATILQTGRDDRVAPVLVSAVAPGSVDASLSSQSVIVDAVVTDDVAGVSDVFIWVLGPDGQDIQNGNATLISGDAMSGTYRNTFTIPRYAQSGNWRVDVQLRDAAGNLRSVSSAAIIAVQ